MTLRHVAKAHGMSKITEKSGMAWQATYRALSENGNPQLSSLRALLDAIGLRLSVANKAGCKLLY
jgi:probable addiction module antidote protein